MARPGISENGGGEPARVAAPRGGRRRAVVREVESAPPSAIVPPKPAARPTPFTAPVFPRLSVEISRFGAVGNGSSDATGAIADAIDELAEKGGGTVVVPSGHFFTGRIHLKSNIRLHLSEGAVLQFSDEPRRYLPPVFARAFGQECLNYSPLIYAHKCSNIAITGPGVIEGRGERWWSLARQEAHSVAKLYDQVLGGVAPQQRRFGSDADPIRPPLIGFIDCNDVLLDGFTVAEGGPLWTIHLAYCGQSTLRGLKIDTAEGPNNDCIVIDSCQDVLIESCDLRSRDDCIALKSGLNEDGWRVGRPTANVTIRNIRTSGGSAGIAIGSEMSGGVRNVSISEIDIDAVEFGIRFKAARGRGGVIEEIHVADIRMKQVLGDAIHLTTDHSAYLSPDGTSPVIRNIVFERVRCAEAKFAARLVGLPDRCIEDVLMDELDLVAEQGVHCFSAQRIHLHNVRVRARQGPAFSLRDTRGVYINGLHQPSADRVFLDLRGRLTRDVRLTGEATEPIRPVIVLGVDVPRDAIFLD